MMGEGSKWESLILAPATVDDDNDADDDSDDDNEDAGVEEDRGQEDEVTGGLDRWLETWLELDKGPPIGPAMALFEPGPCSGEFGLNIPLPSSPPLPATYAALSCLVMVSSWPSNWFRWYWILVGEGVC